MFAELRSESDVSVATSISRLTIIQIMPLMTTDQILSIAKRLAASSWIIPILKLCFIW